VSVLGHGFFPSFLLLFGFVIVTFLFSFAFKPRPLLHVVFQRRFPSLVGVLVVNVLSLNKSSSTVALWVFLVAVFCLSVVVVVLLLMCFGSYSRSKQAAAEMLL
jgi:hypothetical protein